MSKIEVAGDKNATQEENVAEDIQDIEGNIENKERTSTPEDNNNIKLQDNSNEEDKIKTPSVKSISRKSSMKIVEPQPLTIKENDYITAKSYLLSISTESGDNLYDHLVRVLTKIFDEKPKNAIDIFENISKDEKKKKFHEKLSTVQNKFEKTTEVILAEIQEKLFTKGEQDDEEVLPEDDVESPLPNLLELSFYFEQGGVGLSKEEIVRIWLALKNLVDNNQLEHVRFWGKIYGTEQNYIIAEAELRDDADLGEEEEEMDEDEQIIEKENELDEETMENIEDDTPKPDFKPTQDLPKEEFRVGSNKKLYYVCNDPGKPWIRLPHVTPAQIFIARQIKKLLTGRLDQPIISYPPFPGNESNYLRTQIARISAGTHISPLNFYTFDEEEEAEDDEGGRENFMKNEEFEGYPLRELVDPQLQSWVHHVQHILPQGRCKWWNPSKKGEEEMEEEDEDEDREEADEPQPEVGPALLTPLSEDADVDGMPPWTAKITSTFIPQHAIALMRSNLWPGAYAFGHDKKFENVYIGNGLKYSSQTYNPPAAPPIMEEFPTGDEVTEKDDPTPEEEAALRQAQEVELEEEEMMEEEDEEDD